MWTPRSRRTSNGPPRGPSPAPGGRALGLAQDRSSIGSWKLSQELFKNDRSRRGIHVRRTRRMRLGGRVTLVHLVHRQMETTVQLSGEAPRSLGIVVRSAIGVKRNTHDERVGFP